MLLNKLHILTFCQKRALKQRYYSTARALKLGEMESKVVKEADVSYDRLCTVLENGGTVALPTDTIYGIASSALSTEGIEKLYDIKGRRRDKPIAVCVGEISDIDRWAINTVSNDLLEALLPGPVTLCFERRPSLNHQLNPDTKKIGIRIPDQGTIVKLAQQYGYPIALTSANISDGQSTLSINEFQSLWPKLDVVVDGGRIGDDQASRSGSTVIDLSEKGFYSIIRPGCAASRSIKLLEQHSLIART